MGDGKGLACDLHGNRITRNRQIHQGPVHSVTYQPEGDGTFISAGEDGVIKVNLEDDRRQFTFTRTAVQFCKPVTVPAASQYLRLAAMGM